MQQRIKIIVSVMLLPALVVASGIYEFFVIPATLLEGRQMGPLLFHLAAITILAGASALAGAWGAKQTILSIHERLIASHLNALISSITKLATGHWSSDSQIQRGVFTNGARLGYALRDEVVKPDRAQVVEGLAGLELPRSRGVPGQGNEAVGDMDRYLDDLESKKRRLGVTNE